MIPAVLLLAPGLLSAGEDEDAIRANAAAYVKAFNAKDLATIEGLWSENGTYTDENGNVTKGRQAIVEKIKSFFADKNSPVDLKISVESVRILKGEVAVESGTTELAVPNSEPEAGRYTAIHVKEKGKWVLDSVQEVASSVENPHPAIDHALYLAPLEFLVGTWTAKNDGLSVVATGKWTPKKTYLMREMTVTDADGKEIINVTQRIGYSPISKQIKSWVFDSEGGFAEGLWSRSGDDWIVQTMGVLKDGKVGSSTNTYTLKDAGTFAWKSTGRRVDGHPIPDVEVTFTKTAAESTTTTGATE
jgi:uncharacterized protein (TIGR02246 family)